MKNDSFRADTERLRIKRKSRMIFSLLIVVSIFMLLCGCQSESEDDGESSLISYSVDDEFAEDIAELFENYFNALKEQNYDDFVQYTSEEYYLNYNQTEFEELSKDIDDYEVNQIHFDTMTEDDGEYTLCITYTLYPSDEDSDAEYDEYIYYDEAVIILNDNEEYIIYSLEHMAMG